MGAAINNDGGETKTAFALRNESGIFVRLKKSGCSYLEIGKEAVVKLVVESKSW